MSKLFCSLLGVFLAAGVLGADVKSSAVLVVPNRYTLVQFAFDMLRLRPVRIVAYGLKEKTGEPVIFLWKPATGTWDRMQPGDYSSGFGLSAAPVVIVRDTDGMPPVFDTAPAWSSDMKLLDTPDTTALANMMNDRLHFSADEWRWLAPRYGLKIRDLNDERRRYGRYGKPGRGPIALPEPGTVTPVPLPEAGFITEETAPAAEKPVAEEPAEPFEKGAVPPPVSGIENKPAVSPENKPAVKPETPATEEAKAAAAILDAGAAPTTTDAGPAPMDK
jgi:hypothetical protein